MSIYTARQPGGSLRGFTSNKSNSNEDMNRISFPPSYCQTQSREEIDSAFIDRTHRHRSQLPAQGRQTLPIEGRKCPFAKRKTFIPIIVGNVRHIKRLDNRMIYSDASASLTCHPQAI